MNLWNEEAEVQLGSPVEYIVKGDVHVGGLVHRQVAKKRKRPIPMSQPTAEYLQNEIGMVITYFKDRGIGKLGQSKVNRILLAHGAETISQLKPSSYRSVIHELRRAWGTSS